MNEVFVAGLFDIALGAEGDLGGGGAAVSRMTPARASPQQRRAAVLGAGAEITRADRGLHQFGAVDDDGARLHPGPARHTNRCPVGVATQDPRRARALDVADKSERVYRYQKATVAEAMRLMASMKVDDPAKLSPNMLHVRLSASEHRSYAELYTWLQPEALLDDAAPAWRRDWAAPDPDAFSLAGSGAQGTIS